MNKYYQYGNAQYKASQKYKKTTIKRVVLNLNRNTDTDIIEFLEAQNNVQGKIKEILRKEINNGLR